MKKIIIRTPNFLGDTINTTPCIQLIKQEYPDVCLVIIGPEFVRDIFKYEEKVCRFITFPLSKKRKLSTFCYILKELYKEKGDLGIIFVNTFFSALLFKLAGVKCNIGYKQEGRGLLLNFKLHLNCNKHYINRYASLFNEFVGNKYSTLPDLYLPINKKETFNFNNTKKTIGFYPGGQNKSPRNYPAEHSVQLIRLLHAQGYNIVLIGDKNDNKQQEDYVKSAGCEQVINLTGKTTIEDFFNTIASVDVLVTIDSAALHAAAALKTPFIGLMGLSTSPTSTITPKVSFGKILKIENNLIREEDYIRNITPDIIIKTIKEVMN